jgi:hypothetical protein
MSPFFPQVVDVQSNINTLNSDIMNGILTTPFRATPDSLEVYSGRLLVALRDLKIRLQAQYERRFPGERERIREAIAEAEVVAWHTPFPHLFLPDLAEEAIAQRSFSSTLEHGNGIVSFANVA